MNAYFKITFLIISTLSVPTIHAQIQPFTIKNIVTVDKPVSPILYGNFVEMGFGRCENLWAEMLYNRSFEEDNPYTPDWVQFTKPKKEMEDWWHSGYEQQPWYFTRSSQDTLSTFKKNRGYWPACHSKTDILISNKSKTDAVYYAQDGMYIRKNMAYHFSGYFNCNNGFGADKLADNPVDIVVGLYQEKDLEKNIRADP